MLPKFCSTVFVFSIFIAVLLLSKPIQSDDDEGGEDDEERPRSCYQFTGDFATSGIKTALKCVANLKPKFLSEYLTRSYCILKCIFTEFGTIDGEGRFDDIAAAFFFEETFAPEVQADLLPKVQGCFALAEQFDPKDYWCKTYSAFASCTLRAVVSSVLPYGLNCYTSPVVATFLDALKYITPDPIVSNDVEEMKREYKKQLKKQYKCLNLNCTTKYKIQKINGTSTMLLYDRNLTQVVRTLKKTEVRSFKLDS